MGLRVPGHTQVETTTFVGVRLLLVLLASERKRRVSPPFLSVGRASLGLTKGITTTRASKKQSTTLKNLDQ